MLKNHIISNIKEQLNYSPTKGQGVLIDSIANFVLNINKNEIFLIKGYAGTGKTTTISALVKVLSMYKIKTNLLAPTGRAAKVLSAYSKKNAFTIHKKIYRQKSSRDGFGKFVLDKNLHSQTIFIVDEASMISNSSYEQAIFGSGRLLDDLIEYVFNDKNCKLIIIGDTAQLPPVGLDISPALDKSFLENYGIPVTEVFLSDVIRQSKESGILYNATYIRNLIGEKVDSFPVIRISDFKDVIRVSGENLIEEISESYEKNGLEETIVVCRSNKRANIYNQGIRNQILWREDEISVGDYLMVVKNNYHWLLSNEMDFIANGDIVQIEKIKKYEERYGFRFANVVLKFSDNKNIEFDAIIMLDTLSLEAASLGGDENKKFYQSVLEDYAEVKSKKEQYEKVKSNPYFNALQVKFAYAVTCHKAQGGQWDNIFIDQGFVNEDMLNTQYLRWLYTALTRSVKKVFLVNFRKEFFDNLDNN